MSPQDREPTVGRDDRQVRVTRGAFTKSSESIDTVDQCDCTAQCYKPCKLRRTNSNVLLDIDQLTQLNAQQQNCTLIEAVFRA